MKKALAGLLIFGMVFSAMVVPAAASGRHSGSGCHQTWTTATQTGVCPWSGQDCPWGEDCTGWCVSGGVCPWSGEDCPWGTDCAGWCVSGGLHDGTGWVHHHR